MKLRYNSEMIAGIIFSIVGLTLWFMIPGEIPTMEHSSINAQTMPRIAIGGMTIFSLCLLVEGIVSKAKREVVLSKALLTSPAFKLEMRSVIYALFLVAYCVLVWPLGFVASTVALVVAIMVFYGARTWYYYAIPLAMIGVVYWVFTVFLHVSLP